MFEPFYTTKPPGQGTGLGLPLAAAIVREHGGTLRVDTRPGAGTTVEVELPVGRCPGGSGDEGGRGPRGSTRMSRILVVEDEDVIRSELARLLARTGPRRGRGGFGSRGDGGGGRRRVRPGDRRPPAPGRAGDDAHRQLPADAGAGHDQLRHGARGGGGDPEGRGGLRGQALRPRRVPARGRPGAPPVAPAAAERGAASRTSSAPTRCTAWWASCPAMREVFERVRKVAATDATVLILGESGTGKELVARAVHDREPPPRRGRSSPSTAPPSPRRSSSPSCSATRKAPSPAPRTATIGLVEAADGGTLFLDEIGELSPRRAGRSCCASCRRARFERVGAHRSRSRSTCGSSPRPTATSPTMSKSGQFRERPLLPPARGRRSAFRRSARAARTSLALADFFLPKLCRRAQQAAPARSRAPRPGGALRAYHWPGNVRELENAIERAVILSDGGQLSPDLLAIDGPRPAGASMEGDEAGGTGALTEYFRRFVLEHQGHLSETEIARRLGISRKALWEKRARLGIPRSKLPA